MIDLSRYSISNILDEIEGGEKELIEELSTFSCPHNPEIETFIKRNAIEFAKRKLSITYLVIDETDGAIDAYFTLTHKAIDIPDIGLSKTSKKRLGSFSWYDPIKKTYSLSAFLLAQFGKNYAIDQGQRITGEALMALSDDILEDVQRRIGGGVVYLDCEDKQKLIDFYENTVHFRKFNERISDIDSIRYLQYMRFL